MIGLIITVAIVGIFIVFLFLILKKKDMDQTQQSTQSPTTNPLDEKIKAKFKLFQGIRSQEEDQKIYDKVMDLTFKEIMVFLDENLDEKNRDEALKVLMTEGSEQEKTKSLQTYLTKIDNVKEKLEVRLESFLNNLLYASLKAVK